jgi:hypothetical protein
VLEVAGGFRIEFAMFAHLPGAHPGVGGIRGVFETVCGALAIAVLAADQREC